MGVGSIVFLRTMALLTQEGMCTIKWQLPGVSIIGYQNGMAISLYYWISLFATDSFLVETRHIAIFLRWDEGSKNRLLIIVNYTKVIFLVSPSIELLLVELATKRTAGLVGHK